MVRSWITAAVMAAVVAFVAATTGLFMAAAAAWAAETLGAGRLSAPAMALAGVFGATAVAGRALFDGQDVATTATSWTRAHAAVTAWVGGSAAVVTVLALVTVIDRTRAEDGQALARLAAHRLYTAVRVGDRVADLEVVAVGAGPVVGAKAFVGLDLAGPDVQAHLHVQAWRPGQGQARPPLAVDAVDLGGGVWVEDDPEEARDGHVLVTVFTDARTASGAYVFAWRREHIHAQGHRLGRPMPRATADAVAAFGLSRKTEAQRLVEAAMRKGGL